MPTYNVKMDFSGSAIVTVEAESKQDAIDQAEDIFDKDLVGNKLNSNVIEIEDFTVDDTDIHEGEYTVTVTLHATGPSGEMVREKLLEFMNDARICDDDVTFDYYESDVEVSE